MKDLNKPIPPTQKDNNSQSVLEVFFSHSLQEMYYAENEISKVFALIKDQIKSSNLIEILEKHYAIHLKHKERLERIFKIRNESIETKACGTFDALLSEGLHHLSIFSGDTENWEIALILVSQKLTHYKIASYGGLAHLAIKLNYYKAATLLANSVQAEEEFIANNLNSIFDAFLASHVAGYHN